MVSKRIHIFPVLIFFFTVVVVGQGSQVNDENNEKLKTNILSLFKSEGEEGVRNFIKKHKDGISNQFIVDLAKAGFKEKQEEWLQVCKIMAEEKRDERTMADVLYSTGEYFRSISDNKRANYFFDKALAVYHKLNDSVSQGNIYLRKGIMCINTRENSRALEMYEKALLFFKKSNDPRGLGNVYTRIGDIYFYMGNNSKAFDMYEKSLPFFKKLGNLRGQGNVYLRMGEIYFRTGENSKALEMCDKALPFLKEAGNPFDLGSFYTFMGGIYLRTGEYSKALDLYDRALPLLKKSGDNVNQGYLYMSKGDFYFYTGDISKALEKYNTALPFFEKTNHLIHQGDLYLRMGAIYLKVGENSKAFKMYDKALFFFEKARAPIGQGNVYLNKGMLYFYSDNNLIALDMYNNALLFFEKAEDSLGLGNVYLKMGNIFHKTGKNSQANSMYEKALNLYNKVGSPISQGNVYLGKGDIYFSIKDNSRALEMYDKALSYLEKAGAVESESNALHGKAKILAKMGKKNQALELFEKGIMKLDKIRTQTSFSEMKRTFMEKVYEQYEETVKFMLENKYYDKGFKYAESTRSRVFLDRMAEGLVKLDKGLSPGLKENRDKLVAKLSILSKEMNEAAGKNDEKKLLQIKQQYHKIQNELEELLIKIRLNNPLYAAVRYPQPISANDFQENVLKPEELLLHYFISRDNVYVFLVSKKDFNVITQDVKEKDINEIVSEYLFSVEEKNSRRVRKCGRQLYRQLFKPLESAIKDRKEIIIIPNGELTKIPFESLIIDDKMSRKPIYLLEKYRVKYIQSASILAILRKHYQRDSATKHFIGFGDPVYDYKDFELGKTEISTTSTLNHDAISGIHCSRYEREGGIFTRLKSSGEEVNDIAILFKKQSQKWAVHLRQNANEANAKSPDLKEFDYIHFACHAILGNGFQSLVLSQLPKSAEDGYLTLNEIMNCDYRAKLVVLSACQTGRGKMEKGEGVTGLTQAVMYAGTPAVVASLWNVEDISTKELMVKFYKYMVEEDLDKAEALRKAKLDLIKSKKYSSPFYWSAFVMYGE